VYPKYPYVRRQLSPAKLLVALDVPSMRVKQVDAGTTLEWIRLLHLPLKVCAEVCEWLYELLRVGGRKRRAEEDVPAESTWLQKIGRTMDAGDTEGTLPPGKLSAGLKAECVPQDLLGLDKVAQDKAAKHDDAEVPIHLWNDKVRENLSHLKLSDEDLDRMRQLVLVCWKPRVGWDFGQHCRRLRVEA
jgi:hypothetical protein